MKEKSRSALIPHPLAIVPVLTQVYNTLSTVPGYNISSFG
jgi:hypothetical protein